MSTHVHDQVSTEAAERPPTKRRRLRVELTPAQSIGLGFTLITLIGAVLLATPMAAEGGAPVPFLDALFTATSAVTTTGLIVVDTGTAYSLFGELVILALFQVGGLGYMLFIVYFTFLLGTGLSLRAGLVMRESVAGVQLGRLKEFVQSVLWFAFGFEVLGAAALTVILADRFPLGRAVYLAIFHSVSAFCTAGFSLFADSFVAYADSVPPQLVIALVTFAGGIGFLVLRDLRQVLATTIRGTSRHRFSIHTKLALLVSLALIAAGSLLVLATERHALPLRQQVLNATFQALSASTTTGFNTVDIGRMTSGGLFTLILLMFVGTGSGGTGGGIKVTTLGVVLASAAALLRGSQDTVVFKRRMPLDTVYRALTIGMLGTAVVVLMTLILTATEQAGFLSILFETMSAFGTVGLSMGITSSLSPVGKIIISLTMLIGRLGPLAVGFALVGKPRRPRFRYVEGQVFVG